MNNTTEMLAFSQLIKNYRKTHGLTQESFGRSINKKQATVCNWEKDVHYPDDLEEIQFISNMINEPLQKVIHSINYGKKGIIETNETILIELDNIEDVKELKKQFQFTFEGKEVTGDEFKKMLNLLKFERFEQNGNI